MSRKNRDKYNCFRSKIIAFRVSEEENKTLETKVALSGLTKQDYLTHCIDKGIMLLMEKTQECGKR